MKNFSSQSLPQDFLNNIKNLLSQSDYDSFLNSYNKHHYKGIRVNTLKTDSVTLKSLLNFTLTNSPFCNDGFYIPYDTKNLGKSPLHHCGAFYVQEPSATSAVTVLDVKPYDKVLDLCSAPGGKSTQIACNLQNTGLLVSNEIVKTRANILLSNIERMGVANCIVTNSHPDKLCNNFIGFFDKILVDAPCSGEGMFRKDTSAIEQWSFEHSQMCGVRQLEILESASIALKLGGVMVYSTCTFSAQENEMVIQNFLNKHKEFSLIDCGVSFGRPALDKAIRIMPMDGGEGHFIAKLLKTDNTITKNENFYTSTSKRKSTNKKSNIKDTDKNIISSALKLYDEITTNRFLGDNLIINADKIYIVPQDAPNTQNINVIRLGVLFGEIKKNRIEPCHAFFTCGNKNDFKNSINLDFNDSNAYNFLLGQEINIDNNIKGYTAVCINNMTVGFGKATNGVLKNKYPKGLRNLK